MYRMYSFRFWLHFLIFVLLNFTLAKSVNKRIMEGRIVHGKNASISDHAHAVLIQIIKSDRSSHICGSSVLNQKFLITAAHCLNVKGYLKTLAFAGHEDIRKSPVSRMALTTISHKQFKSTRSVRNDIALVVLKEDLPLGAYIKRVIIKKWFPLGVTGTLAGWGAISELTYANPDTLQFLKQKVRGKHCGLIRLKPGMFCAGSMKSSNPTPSFGDSGGGLITKTFQIMGVLSYKINKYPAITVYTNVSYFYSWIEKSIHNVCNKIFQDKNKIAIDEVTERIYN